MDSPDTDPRVSTGDVKTRPRRHETSTPSLCFLNVKSDDCTRIMLCLMRPRIACVRPCDTLRLHAHDARMSRYQAH